MFNKPRCEKAQHLPRKQALYCDGKFLCAHQYHCPQTRQYENTADYSQCTRLPQKEEAKPQAAPIKFVVNVVPKAPEVSNVGPVSGTEPLDRQAEDAAFSGPLQAQSIAQPVTDDNTTSSETVPTPIYTKNVSPIEYGVKKEIAMPAEPEETPAESSPTAATPEVRKEKQNGGTVRSPRRRKPKKG